MTTGPHSWNLNKWLNGYFQRNRVIIYFEGLTRQLNCDLWLDFRCGQFDYPADFKSVFRIWPFGHEFKNASDRTKKVSGAIRQGKSDNRFPHVKMGEILANGLMVIHENRVVVLLSVSWDLTWNLWLDYKPVTYATVAYRARRMDNQVCKGVRWDPVPNGQLIPMYLRRSERIWLV